MMLVETLLLLFLVSIKLLLRRTWEHAKKRSVTCGNKTFIPRTAATYAWEDVQKLAAMAEGLMWRNKAAEEK